MDSFSNKFPWEANISTKDLLLSFIKHADETEKIDFKLDIDIHSDSAKKDELIKDISSIANSHSSDHDNHGFIILGVDADTKEIKGTEINKEELTTFIDDKLNTYVYPQIKVTVEVYDLDTGKKWGAIVIKPTIELPHVITRNSGGINRGDVWVRRGSHKCMAEGSDYSRFFTIRTQSLKRDMDLLEARSILQERAFKERIEALEKRSAIKHSQNSKIKHVSEEAPANEITNQSQLQEKDLLTLVKEALPKHSPLETALLKEVKKGLLFLESNEIPWNLRIDENNKEEAPKVLQKIQGEFELFYKALFELSFFAEDKKSSDIIFNSISRLAKYIHRGGVPYEALYIRYIPLVTSLYIIAMSSIYKKNSDLFKKVIALSLSSKDKYENKYPITSSLFYIRSASNVFDALNPSYPSNKWCDGAGTYQKNFFTSFLADYEEVNDPIELFYQGEFLLSLSPMLSETGFGSDHISSGSFIYYRDAKYILEEFLKNNKALLQDIFGSKLKSILEKFDEDARNIGNRGLCWSEGVPDKATEIVFPPVKIVTK